MKRNFAKMQKYFSAMQKFCENHEFYSCNNYLLRRTCGILCSDSSIFEVLLCHLNKSSFFTFINVWWREFDFISYLFKFLPVHPQYIRSIFALFSLNVRIIFSRNFCIFYFDFFAKQIKVKFCEKSEKFCIFARLQNARMKRNFRENFVLRETIFPYRWKP